MSDYEPGTVALVQCGDGEWRRAIAGFRPCGDAWTFKDGSYRATDDSDVRPLVVLNPKDAEQVEQFAGQLIASLDFAPGSVLGDAVCQAFADTLQAQIRPPKPAEPTGQWAVVEGRDGNRWVRDGENTHLPWRHIGGVDRVTSWEGICHYLPVRVLSEGVRDV